MPPSGRLASLFVCSHQRTLHSACLWMLRMFREACNYKSRGLQNLANYLVHHHLHVPLETTTISFNHHCTLLLCFLVFFLFCTMHLLRKQINENKHEKLHHLGIYLFVPQQHCYIEFVKTISILSCLKIWKFIFSTVDWNFLRRNNA